MTILMLPQHRFEPQTYRLKARRPNHCVSRGSEQRNKSNKILRTNLELMKKDDVVSEISYDVLWNVGE